MIAITYIGHRPVYTDGACGSGLTFKQGQTLNVDDESARKMLRHPSVYELGDMAEAAQSVQSAKQSKQSDKDEDPDQTVRDSIANMSKAALVDYAKVHFQADLDKRMSVADMRTKVTGLYDQFGIE